jgi:hypothetical protein
MADNEKPILKHCRTPRDVRLAESLDNVRDQKVDFERTILSANAQCHTYPCDSSTRSTLYAVPISLNSKICVRPLTDSFIYFARRKQSYWREDDEGVTTRRGIAVSMGHAGQPITAE